MWDSMKDRLRRPSAATVIGTVALAAALGGGAYAAIPGGDGSIKGCYATTDGLLLGIPHSKGDLRAIDEAATCRSYEKQISWNQRGPQGPVGAQGPKGDTGPAGPAGMDGAPAYAHVYADGTLDVANSKNVTVTSASSGTYCLRTSIPVHVVAATLRQGAYSSTITSMVGFDKCGGDTVVDIVHLRQDPNSNFLTGDSSASEFYVTFN
jgi:hypothetical protein